MDLPCPAGPGIEEKAAKLVSDAAWLCEWRDV